MTATPTPTATAAAECDPPTIRRVKVKKVKNTRTINLKAKVKVGKGCALLSGSYKPGDGATVSADPEKFQASHTYSADGSYSLTFTATDNGAHTVTSAPVAVTIP